MVKPGTAGRLEHQAARKRGNGDRRERGNGTRRRQRRQPQGLERLTLGYLAVLLTWFGGGLVAAGANPVVRSAGWCADDPTEGLCQPFLVGAAALVGSWGLLCLVAWIFAFGAGWAGWIVLADLVALQLILQTNQLWWAAGMLAAPALAAVVTRPAPGPRGWSDYLKAGLAGLILVQLVVWTTLWLTG